ncbi:MAG: hypothetical protein PWQ10_20 [Patescibacteria group bacterium]|nr:hypothetical protein [Patescibacteria group bacterium]
MVYYNVSSYNSNMFLMGMLSWWYSNGLLGRVRTMKDRLITSVDFFSINLLISTLFAPYKQISAGAVVGSLTNQMHAFFDRLVSRFIGAFVRGFMILLGSFTILLQVVFGVTVLIFWLILPLLPIIGLILTVVDWIPIWKI